MPTKVIEDKARAAYENTERLLRKVIAERDDALKQLVKALETLRIFIVNDETMEQILWGDKPDSEPLKITIPLGKYRQARAVMTAIEGA